VHLRVEDIDHKSLTIKVRAETTKNGKERLVVLSPALPHIWGIKLACCKKQRSG